jgi:hypothetical protein
MDYAIRCPYEPHNRFTGHSPTLQPNLNGYPGPPVITSIIYRCIHFPAGNILLSCFMCVKFPELSIILFLVYLFYEETASLAQSVAISDP